EFSKEEKKIIVNKIQVYFSEKLDQEIEQFDAEFLLDFFSKEIGVYFYNQGLNDAQAVLSKRMDNIIDAIYEIEKPTEFLR
ncbi:MAG: DUF2164 domain-containing protein, partial [Desulfobacteraceae bacterium]|nr:DUF2164 domain-containing protein [Desulfobacteraceae bacterium]